MILSMKAIQDIKLEGNQMELPVPQLQNPESNKQSSKAQVLCVLEKYKHTKAKKVHMCFEEFNSINCDNHLGIFS